VRTAHPSARFAGRDPVDWRTGGREDLARPFTMASNGLKLTDTAAHEWIGLFGYWLTGWSSELFPRP